MHNNELSGLSAAMTGCAVTNLCLYHISVKTATQRCEAQRRVQRRAGFADAPRPSAATPG